MTIILTLALLLVAIPVVPVSALTTVNVDPGEGEIGDTFSISGIGFYPLEYYFFFSSQNAAVGEDIDTEITNYDFLISLNASGDGGAYEATDLTVPVELTDGLDDEPVHGGAYYIYMTRNNNTEILAKTTFMVTGIAEITGPNPNEGIVGTEVEISGMGFAPSEAIIVEYDGEQIDIDSGDEDTDDEGAFTLHIIIPESEFDEHIITIKGEDSLIELETAFTIEPNIGVNPSSGEPGSIVLVTGTGFDRNNGIDFSFSGTPVTDMVWLVTVLGITNSNGTFAVNLTVPDVGPGSYGILAQDEDDNDVFDSTFFTVISTTTPTPTPTVTVTTTMTTTPEPTTITTTVTEQVTTTPTPVTITTTSTEKVTTTPIPVTITATVTEEITNTPKPTTITTTKTEQATITTQIKEGSPVNIWLPIVTALGAIILTIVALILYSSRQRGL